MPMFDWLKGKLKRPEDRGELDGLRGELMQNIADLEVKSRDLEQLMKAMLAERAKDASR